MMKVIEGLFLLYKLVNNIFVVIKPSNICSNQALNALASSIAMSALGKQGIYDIAVQNLEHANYAKINLKTTVLKS